MGTTHNNRRLGARRLLLALALPLAFVLQNCGVSGLGQQISLTAQMFKTPDMYAWMFYTSFLALVCVRLTDMLELRVHHWM